MFRGCWPLFLNRSVSDVGWRNVRLTNAVHLSGLQMTFSRMNNKTSASTSLLRQLRDVTLLKKLLYLDLPGEVVCWISEVQRTGDLNKWIRSFFMYLSPNREWESFCGSLTWLFWFEKEMNWQGKTEWFVEREDWQRFSILEWCLIHFVGNTNNYNVIKY